MPDTGTAEKKSNKERIKEIVAGIEDGIQKLFQSEQYFDYLRTMSRFHNYSVNNTILIHLQRPNASVVAGFKQWKNRFGRHVKKGEKGITVIAPTPFKKKVEEMKLDPDTHEPVYSDDGQLIMEEKVVEIPMFKPVKVFDVSQTEGKPLPQLSADLAGDVQQYEAFMEALRRSSPVPIEFQPIDKSMDGYFSTDEQKIVVRTGMSQVQTVCAAVHEIGHAMLHNREQAAITAAAGTEQAEKIKPKDRRTEEVEAESLSYSVCAYYGIETGSNSFGYIASWSKDKSLPELRASLETITKTANALITSIDKHFAEICKERGIALSEREEQSVEEAPALPDTPERFAQDYCLFLQTLYEDGIIENPFAVSTRETITAELAEKAFGRGYFDETHKALTNIHERTGSPLAASLLDRLEKLSDAWDAALTYEIEKSPFAGTEEPRSYIKSFEKIGDGYAARNIIFSGPPDVCEKLLRELQDGTATTRQVRAMYRQQIQNEAASEVEVADTQPEEPVLTEETALDEYPMPDPALSDVELEQNYGYMDGDLLPLSKERAAELLERDLTVYAIVDGGQAEMVFDRDDLDERPPDMMFAVSKDEWEVSPDFRQAVADRMNRQEEREAAMPGFFRENPLKNAELLMEDDANMIDGIINNGPKQPTVAELEARVKAGQTISLMDLAAATHREQRGRKKSVSEQLKKPPKQQQKRTAPKRSAERER